MLYSEHKTLTFTHLFTLMHCYYIYIVHTPWWTWTCSYQQLVYQIFPNTFTGLSMLKPVMGLNKVLEMTLASLSDENIVLSWSVFQEKNGQISVKNTIRGSQ